MAKTGFGGGAGVGGVLLALLVLLDGQVGPSPCPSRRRALSLTPDMRAGQGCMLRIAHTAFTRQTVWSQDVAAVALLPGARVFGPASLLTVEGPADPHALTVKLRHTQSIEHSLASSFASCLALVGRRGSSRGA